MAQLLIRNLSDEVKERLKRRAKAHGRSVEAEAREVLQQVPDVPSLNPTDGKAWVDSLVARLAEIGVTKDDVDDLEAAMAELGRDRRTYDLGGDK